MGNSLSQHSQAILEAAAAGDALLLQQQIACEPKLLQSVTLVKRRSVLHLAARQGHPHIISAVLEPLLVDVRREYHAHLDEQRRQQSQQPQQQSQPQPQQSQPQQQQQPQTSQQLQRTTSTSAGSATITRSSSGQTTDVVLPSFKKLRATVNARDLYRRTPLVVAAKRGQLECVQLLVDAASNLFAVDREGNTSLHYASLHGHAEVVEYLLQRAIDRGLGERFVNKRNLSGFTALHYAVWSCRTGVVAPLLAAGADITAVNDRVFDAWVPVPIGSTPLHLAVMRASTAVAMLLLQHYVLLLTHAPRDRPRPSDPRTMVNLYGMNPAQLAAHRNNRPMAQLLMPSVSLSRVLSVHAAPPVRVFGAHSLRTIAAAALQHMLTEKLDSVEAAHAAAAKQQAATAGRCSSSSGGAAAAPGHKHTRPSCSVVCVQACGGDDDRQQQRDQDQPQRQHSGCDVVVVHAGVSTASTTPASSRAPSPQGSGAAAELEPSDEEGHDSSDDDDLPSQGRAGSVFAAAAAAGCSSPADSDRASSRTVTFSTPAAADSSEAGGRAVSPLQRALTSASSSGWYDELCCVCWESEVTAVMEPCLHAMCLGCARQLVTCSGKAGVACPLCRGWVTGFAAVPTSVAGGRPPAGKRKKSLLAGAGI